MGARRYFAVELESHRMLEPPDADSQVGRRSTAPSRGGLCICPSNAVRACTGATWRTCSGSSQPIVTMGRLNGKEPFVIVGGTPLQSAVAGGQRAVAKLLLARGAKVNAPLPEGSVPLHLAVTVGDVEVVQLLLANGADVNVRNQAGRTPLAVAEERDEPEMAALLRKQGAKQ